MSLRGSGPGLRAQHLQLSVRCPWSLLLISINFPDLQDRVHEYRPSHDHICSGVCDLDSRVASHLVLTMISICHLPTLFFKVGKGVLTLEELLIQQNLTCHVLAKISSSLVTLGGQIQNTGNSSYDSRTGFPFSSAQWVP